MFQMFTVDTVELLLRRSIPVFGWLVTGVFEVACLPCL